MFPRIEHYSRVVRNQLAHSNISSGKKTILINTFANIDNFLFKRICNLRLVTGSQKIGPLIIFLWFKLFLLVVQFYQLGLFMELFDNLLWTKIGPQKCPIIDQNKTELQVKKGSNQRNMPLIFENGCVFCWFGKFQLFYAIFASFSHNFNWFGSHHGSI